MFILTHATALKPFHSKQSYPLHHLQHKMTTSTLGKFDKQSGDLCEILSQLDSESKVRLGGCGRDAPDMSLMSRGGHLEV